MDDVDPDATVIVSTGDGERFHRPPEWQVFATACKTEFSRETREIDLARAIEEGFTPCDSPGCFGEV